MPSPVRASNTPYPITVEAGKEYWWCACGQSKNQPFCDGSHKVAREFTPMKFTASEHDRLLLRLQRQWPRATLRRVAQEGELSSTARQGLRLPGMRASG